MNDRFLFRGKRRDGSGWIVGDLITAGQKYFIDDYNDRERVETKTVGQCTGLKDKDGKLIFEGDILELIEQGDRKHKRWQVMYDIETAAWLFRNGDNNEDYEWFYGALTKANSIIIGNIHDNLELLGDEK